VHTELSSIRVKSFQNDFYSPDRLQVTQKVKVLGKSVTCGKCKEMAECYCACGTFLCLLHLATHRCIVQLRATYSKEILEALR